MICSQDLEGESFLLTEAGCSYRNALERELNEAGILPSTNLDFKSVEAIKQCCMASMGIAFLPALTVQQEIAEKKLAVLNWEGRSFHVFTQMLWHKDQWLSPAIQAFLSVAREVLKVNA
jgi:DNA-binding transcriptional LysR family regulator